MNKKLRVAVLFGGQSVEHDVSLRSARSIVNALDPEKYEAVPIAITREGHWLPPAPAQRLLGGDPRPDYQSGIQDRSLLSTQHSALESGFDVVFPVVHGTQGEDGTVQGLLELAGLPYVGAGVLASAVGMDKAIMKRVFREAGLPIVGFSVVTRHQWQKDPNAIERLSFPCFVKPSNGGSSVGVSKARNDEELRQALELALQLDRKALIEEGLDARELECSVLGNEEPEASSVGEIVPKREFYDYEAKYHDDTTELWIPAPIPDEVADQVRSLAIQAFQALDCSGMARVDFFMRKTDDALFINEINTIPGFTSVSMYPKLWEAAGVSYPELVDRLIQLALERHRESQATRERYTHIGRDG